MPAPRHDRATLHDVAAALVRLPLMGSVMINTRWNGATHECIGPVESVHRHADTLRCLGAVHGAEIDLSAVSGAVVDRTMRMGERAMHRIDVLAGPQTVLFSVIGMDAAEAFERGLDGLEERPLPPAERPAREPAAVAGGDPGAAPFAAAQAAGVPLRIAIERAGFRQSWGGPVERVSLAMGFVNVIRPEGHLHLRGGAVAGWRAAGETDEGLRLDAVDAGGQATGLSVTGPAAALAAVASA